MLDQINLDNILFLDIETVPMAADYECCPEIFRTLWDRKAALLKSETENTPETLWQRAGIYAEFGKIICISVAFFNGKQLRVKSFYSDEEKLLLEEFAEMLNRHYNKEQNLLCAHNGKEFDFPYMARRMLINGIALPLILDMAGRKPWQVQHLDTMELWKFGDYKNYTSLELLAALFNIPTPKDDIKGSDIAQVYWVDHDLERIVKYCQKDVITVAQLILRYQGKPLLKEADIQIS
jgi:3'-5' exonuclease